MSLLSTPELIKWIGYEPGQVRRLERWLIQQGIPYFPGKGGDPITTTEAINAKLIGSGVTREEIEFDGPAQNAH